MDEEYCPECGEELAPEDDHYMLTHDCCKCCYDDFHFGEPEYKQ